MDRSADSTGERRDSLSSIEYAVLAMVGLKGQSAYELALFAKDEKWGLLGYSRSRLYELPKKLEEKGYLTSTVEPAQKRGSKRVYHLTRAGVDAARSWLGSTPTLPPVDSELVARILASDLQLTDELLTTLLALGPEVRRRRAEIELAELKLTSPAQAFDPVRLAYALHRHMLDAYTKGLKDVERERKKLERRRRT